MGKGEGREECEWERVRGRRSVNREAGEEQGNTEGKEGQEWVNGHVTE